MVQRRSGGSRVSLHAVRVPPFIQQEEGVNGRWPFRDFLELGALDSAVPCARLHARQVLWERGLAALGDRAELVVSELVTNAVKASRAMTGGGAVGLWLACGPGEALIAVWDSSTRPPVRVQAGGEAEHGRGLVLVEALSHRWGWCPGDGRIGKFVWAIV